MSKERIHIDSITHSDSRRGCTVCHVQYVSTLQRNLNDCQVANSQHTIIYDGLSSVNPCSSILFVILGTFMQLTFTRITRFVPKKQNNVTNKSHTIQLMSKGTFIFQTTSIFLDVTFCQPRLINKSANSDYKSMDWSIEGYGSGFHRYTLQAASGAHLPP